MVLLMVANVQYLALKKITGSPTKISWAAKHNLREIVKEKGANSNIDSVRTPKNLILAGADTAAARDDVPASWRCMRVRTQDQQRSKRYAECGGCQAARLLAAATGGFGHRDPGLLNLAPAEVINVI